MKGHLKSLTVPNTWPIKKKENVFVARPLPSKSFRYSVTLLTVFKIMLRECKTAKEVRTLLREQEIQLNGKRVYHPKTLVGIFDVLTITTTKQHYIMLLNTHNTLILHPIAAKEATTKISRVKGKTVLAKDSIQLNLFEGFNTLTKKSEQKVGDSVVISLPDLKVKDTLPLKKGAYVFLIGGNHVGEHGTVDAVNNNKAVIKAKSGHFETLLKFVYVVGEGKPVVSLP